MLLLSAGESDIDFHSPATLCKNLVSPCRDHSLNKYTYFHLTRYVGEAKPVCDYIAKEYYGTLDITWASAFLF